MRSVIVCLNDETVRVIKDYAKVRRLSSSLAINDLIMKGYWAACEELKRYSLKKEREEEF